MKARIFVLSVNMYRVSCLCAKTEFYRTQIVPTWINRKCKKCKSNLIVYNDDTLVINYNSKKDRELNRPIRKRKVVKKQSHVQIPVSLQNVFVPFFPEITNPVKNDVFMGYQGPVVVFKQIEQHDVGVQSEMEIDVDLDICKSEGEDELFEFEKYKLTI
jgi:hypothetical protein